MNKQLIIRLSQTLLEKETLDLKGIIEILGERPFAPKANFVKYLDSRKEIDKEIAEKFKNSEEKKEEEAPQEEKPKENSDNEAKK